ncbi:Stealth CR1 domain-containing protein [Nitratireductor aquimarinus]|uniref:stealth family protein n=1 Tax=Alphaproteobacteria TaxID=28211 RepID=UPI0019D33B5F|nr:MULTISPECIES: stealth family protein [Alphaproteobacteria]MBN7758997.1 Stealth CR1 domain-containing protein [Nitratireductor aquimarinus]MBY6001670.1 stealth family protein [Tritonibacter mobilis]MBY6023958.1 stealth family protein [Nitratireductor sp. DP7N14-4]
MFKNYAKKIIRKVAKVAREPKRSDLPSRAIVPVHELADPAFPIDIVYTWVDGSDPDHIDAMNRFLPPDAKREPERFHNHDELMFSLRSIEKYAPWVNHIYVVTNGQRPHWLVEGPKLTVISHDQILDPEYLPTFNSHVIGSALHRIPGLSEHYIYFNDDIMLSRPMEERDFFTAGGLLYGFLSSASLPNRSLRQSDAMSVWAQKNAQALIYKEWGVWFDRRFKHSYHPQRRSVGEDVERRFADQIHATRLNKFRTRDDLVIGSTLNTVTAYMTGKGLFRGNRTFYVPVRDQIAPSVYEEILASRGTGKASDAICLNDAHKGSAIDGYEDELLRFLELYFPGQSSFEIQSQTDAQKMPEQTS